VARGLALIGERGLAPYLRTLAAQGKPMEGVSAGAVMLGRHAAVVRQRRRVLVEGLGIVPCSLDAHGDDDGWRDLRALARLLAGSDQPEVYGIAAHGAAVWRGDRLAPLGEPLVRYRCGARPTSRPPLV